MLKLEVVKMFNCDKYKSTYIYTYIERERERERENKSRERVVFFLKKINDKIVVEWEESGS